MPIMKAKLKKAVSKAAPWLNLDYSHVSPITVNGAKRGVSGFIQNIDNGTVVYVNTEPCVCGGWIYARYARDIEDYTGGYNRKADSLEELVNVLVDILPKKVDAREPRVCGSW